MSDGLTVPPNWTRDDPDWEEDVGRKYDPRTVVEYEHLDQPLRIVLSPSRVPPAVADDERGYRVDVRYGTAETSIETYELAAVPSLSEAHAVAEDFMRLYTEFGAGGDRVGRVIADIARTKEEAWAATYDALIGDVTDHVLA